ncbi:hypothetical protein COHA_002798 [Chlorella ohadii]|uniref:C3H1-type domain-containing protein n=1 Tax=Chlorella ohadii TaxID=2649997 RepID=A0AAD5DWI2_9CHLO|nr:hypothetical protein COHA_002798 [Chlorella ohadii]
MIAYGAAQSGFTSSDKARFLLRPSQSDQLCKNPKPCSYGDRCIFAHNMEEQRRFRQAYSSGSSGNGGSQGDKQAAGSKAAGQPDAQAQAKQSYCPPDKFKTLLCYYFQRQGYCTRGAQCSFAHGASELRSNSQQSSRDNATAEFSPAPPPPVAVRAPSSIASVASDSAGSGSGGGSMHSARSGDAEVQGSIAAAELDKAYALQLQYDEQRGLKEDAQQAQQAQRAPGGSYAAAAVGGTEAPAAVPPPPGLALPRLDSEAAFPVLQASGGQQRAGSEVARSQLHSRAPSSGGCSAADGASPVTACPSEEGEPRPRLHPIDLVGTNGGVDLSVIPHFVCPLTSRPFVDPVVAADGVTYERDVIEFLLYRKNIEVSPVLRGVRLEHNMLAPNTALLCAMGEVAALLASMAAAP